MNITYFNRWLNCVFGKKKKTNHGKNKPYNWNSLCRQWKKWWMYGVISRRVHPKKKKNVSLFLETVFELKHSQIVRQWPSCIRFNGTFHIENQDIAWHECVVLSAYASHIGYAKRRPTHWHTSIGDYQWILINFSCSRSFSFGFFRLLLLFEFLFIKKKKIVNQKSNLIIMFV